MFFNDKFGELFSLGSYAVGVIMAASGSMIWVCYGVAQKLLSKHFNSQQILLMIYFCSSFVFLPFAEPSQIAHIGIRFMGLLYLLLPEHADRAMVHSAKRSTIGMLPKSVLLPR